MLCHRLVGSLLLFSILFLVVANAQSGYEIIPLPIDMPMAEQDRADFQYGSFWELPPWVIISYATGAAIIVLGAGKLFLFVLGKIENLLENRNRAGILRYIISNPGSNIAEVSQGQRMNRATVRYHLRKLEAEGKIVFWRAGKFVRVFKNHHAYGDHEKVVLSYLNSGSSRTILLTILECPGITNHDLAKRLAVEKSAVHWHMDKFLKDSLVRYTQDGKYKRYYVKDHVGEILRKFRE